MEHDSRALAALYEIAALSGSTCALSGASLLELRKIGDTLSVDRINSNTGYVVDNMRLISLRLNISKGIQRECSQAAINQLLKRLVRVVKDRRSAQKTIQV